MDEPENRTFRLQRAQTDYIDALVEQGVFPTQDDVVEAGLQALKSDEDSLDGWLRDEVAPVAAATRADPSRTIAAEQVFDEIRAFSRARQDINRRDP